MREWEIAECYSAVINLHVLQSIIPQKIKNKIHQESRLYYMNFSLPFIYQQQHQQPEKKKKKKLFIEWKLACLLPSFILSNGRKGTRAMSGEAFISWLCENVLSDLFSLPLFQPNSVEIEAVTPHWNNLFPSRDLESLDCILKTWINFNDMCPGVPKCWKHSLRLKFTQWHWWEGWTAHRTS